MITDKPTVQQQADKLLTFPKQLLLETTSHCNLNCSMCARQFNPRKWGTLDEDAARKVIDEVTARTPDTRIWFCYFGEPLLKRRSGLFERIRYAKDRGLQKAAINTNGNLLDDRAIADLLEAGLDEVYVGIDATTPEVYDETRRGGDFHKVIQNIHSLCEAAGDKVLVTVQFGVYENNEHQEDDFREYWAKYPVNVFVRPKLTWAGYLSDHVKTKERRYACPWIFDSINVFDTGEVPYCVCDWPNRNSLGTIKEDSIYDIWQKRTRPYLVHHAREEWDKLPKFCQECRDWQTKSPMDPGILQVIAGLDG